MASANSNQMAEIHLHRFACNIVLKQGDLLKETDVDALVIPTPAIDEPDKRNFALFNSLRSQADRELKRQIDNAHEQVVLLEPRYIRNNDRIYILSVPPYLKNARKAKEFLGKTYTSCLALAVKLDIQKIAFPTIGCGVIGFNTNDAAKIVYQSLEKFEPTEGAKLNQIRIVIYDTKVYHPFTSTFITLGQEPNGRVKFDNILDNSTTSPGMVSRGETRDTPSQHPSKSSLNPNAPAFQTKTGLEDRSSCRYLLSDRKTELLILRSNLIEEKVHGIVNVENESMTGSSAMNEAIHQAAGKELANAYRECKKGPSGAPLSIGRSRILLSYKMSKTTAYIITTAGPVYDKATSHEFDKQLESCYETCLDLARLYDLETIAFPAISCDTPDCPVDQAAEIALMTIDRASKDMREVRIVLPDQEMFQQWAQLADDLGFASMDNDRKPITKRPVHRQAKAEEPQTHATHQSESKKEDRSSPNPSQESHSEDEDRTNDDRQTTPGREATGDESSRSKADKKDKAPPNPKKTRDSKASVGRGKAKDQNKKR